VAAAERKQADSDRRNRSRRDALHYEIEQLETRAANARAVLSEFRRVEPGAQATDEPSVACAPGFQIKAHASDADENLNLVAANLADQRLILAQQLEWMCQTRLQWEKDRDESWQELNVAASALEDREAELDYDEAQHEDNKRALAALSQR